MTPNGMEVKPYGRGRTEHCLALGEAGDTGRGVLGLLA